MKASDLGLSEEYVAWFFKWAPELTCCFQHPQMATEKWQKIIDEAGLSWFVYTDKVVLKRHGKVVAAFYGKVEASNPPSVKSQ